MKESYQSIDHFMREECPVFMYSTEIEYTPGVCYPWKVSVC